VLIGTKADLARGPTGESLRQVPNKQFSLSQSFPRAKLRSPCGEQVGYEEARSWAAERCMSYVEVSAKTGMNITAALLTMVSEIAEAAADTAVR
jgi:hypothetical protein